MSNSTSRGSLRGRTATDDPRVSTPRPPAQVSRSRRRGGSCDDRAPDEGDRPLPGVGHARLRQPRAGDREVRPARHVSEDLNVIMGPGCPVCITDMPEVDEGVALARQGFVDRDLRRHAEGARHGACRWPTRRRRARRSKSSTAPPGGGARPKHRSGSGLLRDRVRDDRGGDRGRRHQDDPPKNFSVLSAHKYIPPVMEIVAEMPETRVEGFLAAGHAATITGWGIFEPFVERHRIPVVVAGSSRSTFWPGWRSWCELDARQEAAGSQHVSALRDTEGNLARPGGAVERLPARRRTVARASRTSRTGTCACATSGRISMRAAASRSI